MRKYTPNITMYVIIYPFPNFCYCKSVSYILPILGSISNEKGKITSKEKKRVQGYFAKINAKIRLIKNKVFICCEILRYMFIYVYKQRKNNGKSFCVMPNLQTICRLKGAFQNVD